MSNKAAVIKENLDSADSYVDRANHFCPDSDREGKQFIRKVKDATKDARNHFKKHANKEGS